MLNPVIHELNITVYCPPNKEFNSNQILSLLKSSKIILETSSNEKSYNTALKCKIENIILGHLDLNETNLISQHLSSDYYIDHNISVLSFNKNTIPAKITFKFDKDLYNKKLNEEWKISSEKALRKKEETDQEKIFSQNKKILSYVSCRPFKFNQEYLFKKYDMYLMPRSYTSNSAFNSDYAFRRKEDDLAKKILLVYSIHYPQNEKSTSLGFNLDIYFASNNIDLVDKICKMDPENKEFYSRSDHPLGCGMPVSLKSKIIRKYFRPIFKDLEVHAGFGYNYYNSSGDEYSAIEYLDNKKYKLKK
jgi:hypothetical protein